MIFDEILIQQLKIIRENDNLSASRKHFEKIQIIAVKSNNQIIISHKRRTF